MRVVDSLNKPLSALALVFALNVVSDGFAFGDEGLNENERNNNNKPQQLTQSVSKDHMSDDDSDYYRDNNNNNAPKQRKKVIKSYPFTGQAELETPLGLSTGVLDKVYSHLTPVELRVFSAASRTNRGDYHRHLEGLAALYIGQ